MNPNQHKVEVDSQLVINNLLDTVRDLHRGDSLNKAYITTLEQEKYEKDEYIRVLESQLQELREPKETEGE